MWHGVPFARQRRPIVGVLRVCWLLPGSFDCFCCPHTSVHRPSIACLAVFLCGAGALFLHALSGPSTICPFSPHGWSAPDGLPLLLRKQPIWAAGDTPHLMPVEQGLPWHPVATGLAGQAIPFIVAASHAHALPSAPFCFSVPAVPVASPALLCPSSLSAVPALIPPGVAPAFCVSVLLLPLSGGAAGCPCRAPPPVPPACPPIRGFHISIQRGLPPHPHLGNVVTIISTPGLKGGFKSGCQGGYGWLGEGTRIRRSHSTQGRSTIFHSTGELYAVV